MRKYFLIGKRAELRAESDQIAAVAIATVGDYGFTDRFKLQKFPATWSELEFSWYLSPEYNKNPTVTLAQFRADNAEAIAAAVKSIQA